LDIELYKKYKQLGRGQWGKDLRLWKMLYIGAVNNLKDEEFNAIAEMALNIFLSMYSVNPLKSVLLRLNLFKFV